LVTRKGRVKWEGKREGGQLRYRLGGYGLEYLLTTTFIEELKGKGKNGAF